jgi:hypothetical protein
MSTTAIPAEILPPIHILAGLDRPTSGSVLDGDADPPESGPSTSLEPRFEGEHAEEGAEPDDRRGDLDDLPRAS